MTAEKDMIKLYSGRIRALAVDIPHTTRLESPTATAKRRSPLCGSTVTVDVQVEDGRIVDFGQDVKACALGQAAASVVGQNVIGCTPDDIEKARDQLNSMLKAGGPAPDAPFHDLEVLMPARDYKNRHASILLSLEALSDALASAQKSECA
ncbi:iron-sulfur cluster assembly scaffold protein [Pseudaestuariivita rosea]|uniref:iron-sulfur cluster assembly scaffold protein n=1 Tax=Pseudaestuariivita rosea TaxID=2763263 RepID=UPI001ABA566D|nr:iron-sulfur cluster assembly scaffold protein [Pseudaestuariivita rosea]